MISPEQAEQIRKKLLEQVDKLPPEKAKGLREQVLSATPEQLEQYLAPPEERMSCLFCGIAQGKVDTIKVHDGENVLAFLDINPLHPGQIIIVPKEHHEFLFQISDQVVWEIIRLIKVLTPIIVSSTSAQGVSTYFAQGHAAGQVMDHISFNLIPRFEGDKASFAWERNSFEKNDLEEIGKKISDALTKSFNEEREVAEKKIKEEAEKEKEKAGQKPVGFPKRRP